MFLHSADRVREVLELRSQGLGARRISALTGISTRTITDWLAGKVPRSTERAVTGCTVCGHPVHEPSQLDVEAYAYLLGIYLGDGYVARHARGVFRLRISLDARYPRIVDECITAITSVLPGARAAVQARTGPWGEWVEVYSYSKAWPCLLPQHGSGKKHERPIEVTHWQIEIIQAAPGAFLRGLVHSDGCRFENTGRNGWRAPRYSFSNLSEDILALFCWGCELLDLNWTEAGNTIYVSRKADVARLDEYIGPKR